MGSGGVLVLALVAIVNEYAACRRPRAARRVADARGGDLDATWRRYQQITSQSSLGLAPGRVSGAMRDTLVTHADRVIADFRQDRPTVRERQWQQARTWLGNALRLDPGNAALLSRLRYCEGQLSRIDGEARPGAGNARMPTACCTTPSRDSTSRPGSIERGPTRGSACCAPTSTGSRIWRRPSRR